MPQKISLIMRPRSRFAIPNSSGYQIYSAMLAIMGEADEGIAKHAHDSPISSISLCPAEGRFLRSIRPKHKDVNPDERYRIRIGITDPKEEAIFKSIIQPLILKERDLELDGGKLWVEEITSKTASYDEMLKQAGNSKDPTIDITFRSPTCIQYKNTKVFEMFPHREAVFSSLASKWNAVCSDGIRLALDRDEIARHVMEVPDASSYKTHSVAIGTVIDKNKGHPRPILRQGFTGRCRYVLAKNAPADLRNAVLALSRFAEFSGVGSAVSRGCGAVDVGIGEVK